jgi:hypothetical protein
VNVAILPVESSATVPMGFVQSAGQVSVNEAPPVSGATASLKVAVNVVVPTGTLIAPLIGVADVTVGAKAALPFVPRIGSWLLHPTTAALSINAAHQIAYLDF